MAFLRSTTPDDLAHGIAGVGVTLRRPTAADYDAWAALRAASRQHLQPWEPRWSDDDLTRTAFRRRLRLYARDVDNDAGYAFLVFRTRDEALVGGLNLSNVRRGVAQAASMGYWIGAGLTGRGYMTDAVRAMVPFAFLHLHLHRLEAACLPHNGPSLRVLEKSGFLREGFARKYLKIDGLWQDHVLLARVEDEASATQTSRGAS